MRPSLSFTLIAVALATACGADRRATFDDNKGPVVPGSGADGGFVDFGNAADDGLAVDPINAILFVDTSTTPPTPAKQVYKVVRKTANGETDLTAGATFELEKPELGKFTGNTFESVANLPATAPGFTSDITVRVDGGSTGAKLTVVPLRRGADAARDFFFIVPYGQAPTPASDVLKFKTNIQAVDVAFVVDTTGSMSSEINAIRTALGGSLLTQLQAAIPSVGIAIVSHKDEEDPPPTLVEVFQPITTNLSLAQSAAGRLNAIGGGDTPEGQVPAMYHVLTGLPVTGVPAHTPAPGTTGGVDFRPGALPMVVLVTDASWHPTKGGVTSARLRGAFAGANAKFVALTSDGSSDNEIDADNLSDSTQSNLPPSAFSGCGGQCCTGVNGAGRPGAPGGRCRLNFRYSKSSPNIGGGVVEAIKAVAIGTAYDVAVRPRNDTANANGVDATKFIKALRAKDEGDAGQGCPPHPAKDTNGDGINDTFTAVTVGTPVCFEVIPEINSTAEPLDSAQFYNAFLDVVGVPGDIRLDTRKVLFLVPPKAGVTK
ncbi:MAG TPA: VWA domain-containing protein [Polyangiaceae bacterium]|nr:VWA domain-containing protein [Polyangiaceae bacterium]